MSWAKRGISLTSLLGKISDIFREPIICDVLVNLNISSADYNQRYSNKKMLNIVGQITDHSQTLRFTVRSIPTALKLPNVLARNNMEGS